MENAFATFANSSFSFQFIKKNGELGHATSEWKFEFDHNDKPIRLDGILRDITQQTKLENHALKVYEEKNIILESIGDGFYALDKNWVITYWNKQAEIIFKKSRREAIGKNLWELYPDAKNTITYINYHNAVKEKTIQHYERFYEELDRWLEISAYPSSTGLSIFFKDITDRKISEKQLGELNTNLKKHASDLAISNKELEEFAYVASHDLQEPLRMVTGFLGQIEKKYSDVIDDKGKRYIHFAMDGAKRMRQIILDLLEFSRVGRTEDVENYIDLIDTVREVILLCQKQIKETKAIVRFENLPSLVTHKTPLRQVFQNLISNSLKYHIKGITPLINISAEENETHWQFAISDNGIGIEEEYFNKIFVIFQRLHNKDEYSGTGIGLAVCKKIIENLGGKIWLASVPGKGTTFYFTLPKK
jgi:PAS domain S-box-containing protein